MARLLNSPGKAAKGGLKGQVNQSASDNRAKRVHELTVVMGERVEKTRRAGRRRDLQRTELLPSCYPSTDRGTIEALPTGTCASGERVEVPKPTKGFGGSTRTAS